MKLDIQRNTVERTWLQNDRKNGEVFRKRFDRRIRHKQGKQRNWYAEHLKDYAETQE